MATTKCGSEKTIRTIGESVTTKTTLHAAVGGLLRSYAFFFRDFQGYGSTTKTNLILIPKYCVPEAGM